MSAPNVKPTRVHPRRRPVKTEALPSLATDSAEAKSNMQLKKGETFHSPTTPSNGKDPVLNIRSLPRRSLTSLEAIAASEQRMASILERLTLDDTDTAEESTPAKDDASKAHVDPQSPASTASGHSSLDDADLHALWDKKVRHGSGHESDSGLGTSVSSCEVLSTASDSKGMNFDKQLSLSSFHESSPMNFCCECCLFVCLSVALWTRALSCTSSVNGFVSVPDRDQGIPDEWS